MFKGARRFLFRFYYIYKNIKNKLKFNKKYLNYITFDNFIKKILKKIRRQNAINIFFYYLNFLTPWAPGLKPCFQEINNRIYIYRFLLTSKRY